MVSSFRARIGSAARWLAPSAISACGGAIVAGALEGAGMDGVAGAAAAAGFVALVAAPLLLVASVLVRAVWAGWQPGALAEGLVEDGGGAPRLAGWVVALVLGAALVGWAAFQGTWVLAWWTAFKPLPVSFAEPVIAVGAALAAVALSRPIARAATALARRLDARRRRRGRRSLVTPRRIAAALAVLALASCYALWRIVVRPRIGALDVSVLRAPAAGVIAALLVHVAWARLPRARRIAGAVVAAAALAAIGFALVAWRAEPSLTLEIWGDRPLAGLAIDKLFDLAAIRRRISLAEYRPTARPGALHPDIILVTIDTVRADRTPPYGGPAEMPVLRALGEKGAVFDWAFSPSNVTRRSIPSMMLGLAPNRVHGRVVGWALRIDPRHVMLAERMRAAGYDTAGFMCCGGFWGPTFHTGLEHGLAHLEIEPNGAALARKARTWLDERERHANPHPLFLWMHILEPHNWLHGAPEPANAVERRKLYDHVLAGVDRMLEVLLGAFAHRPPGQAPIVIVTADHGEALGDHGQPFHSTDLYDSQTHVPFVIVGPGIPPHHIAETVSLTDLAPTVLDLAGFVPPKDEMDGISVADLATGRRAPDPDGGLAFAAMIKDRSNPGGISAIVQGPWKLIDNHGKLELYNVHTDPGEHANVAGPHGALVKQLLAILRAHLAAGARSPFH